MDAKLEVTIDVIVHATEDISKIFESFKEIFDINHKKSLQLKILQVILIIQ